MRERYQNPGIPKQPALEALKFIAHETIPQETQEQLLGFLNDLEISRVLGAVIDTHGQSYGNFGEKAISKVDGQKFDAALYSNIERQTFMLRMYAFSETTEESERPIYGITLPLLPDGSLDSRQPIQGTWGNRNFKLDGKDEVAPKLFVWALQGCAVRMQDALYSAPATLPEPEIIVPLAA